MNEDLRDRRGRRALFKYLSGEPQQQGNIFELLKDSSHFDVAVLLGLLDEPVVTRRRR